MVWIECVWGGMVTDASVFVLLKRTNQGGTKKRERNPTSVDGLCLWGVSCFWQFDIITPKTNRFLIHFNTYLRRKMRLNCFCFQRVGDEYTVLQIFDNTSNPKSLIDCSSVPPSPSPQQPASNIISFAVSGCVWSLHYLMFWLLDVCVMHPISYSHS